MRSLFSLTLQSVLQGGRRSLKGLTPSLRREINLAWLPRERTWKEKLYQEFPKDRVRGCELTHLIWQDELVASDYMFDVPMYELTYRKGRPDLVRTAGFIYCKCRDDLHLSVFHVRTYEFASLDQDQLFIELFPSKVRLRRLQALLLPVMKPRFDPRSIPVDFDWTDYYRELDRIDHDAEWEHEMRPGRRVENHWKEFFLIPDRAESAQS